MRVPFVGTYSVRVQEAEAGKPIKIRLIRAGTSNGVGGAVHYPKEVLTREAGKFERTPVFDNHLSPSQEKDKPYRSFRDLLGEVTNVSYDPTPADDAPEGGMVGNLSVLESADWFDRLVRSRPDLVNFSIRATGTATRTKPHGTGEVPILEGFQQVMSCDAVMKAGAGGRVLSLSEAAAEETVLLDTLTPEQLAAHPDYARIRQMVLSGGSEQPSRESSVVGDWDNRPEETKWRKKMAKAKAGLDTGMHQSLLDNIPPGVAHDRDECPFCQGLVQEVHSAAINALEAAKPQVAGSGEGDAAMPLSKEELEQFKVIMRESAADAIKPYQEKVDVLTAELRKRDADSVKRQEVTVALRESGLPTTAQQKVLLNLMEVELPTEASARKALIDRWVNREKTTVFGPGNNPRAQWQGDPGTEQMNLQEVDNPIANELEARLENPHIPPPALSGSQYFERMAGQGTQQGVVMGNPGAPQNQQGGQQLQLLESGEFRDSDPFLEMGLPAGGAGRAIN